MMLHRLMIVTSLLAAALAFPAVHSAAGGDSRGQLEDAGWTCIVPLPLDNIHCAPPGGLDRVLSGEAETMVFKVFDADDETFIGTEHIVREDLFQEQPCPTDPPSRQYTYLPDVGIGLPYSPATGTTARSDVRIAAPAAVRQPIRTAAGRPVAPSLPSRRIS